MWRFIIAQRMQNISVGERPTDYVCAPSAKFKKTVSLQKWICAFAHLKLHNPC